MTAATPVAVLVHADESCLGNDRAKETPGGNAALVEAPAGDSVARWDFTECSPATTNNRMALAGAIAVLEWIRRQWGQARVTYVSDSEYLVKGVTVWMPGWKARGWRRKGGAVENLALWQKLDQASAGHTITWHWVRGHAGHPKNEYADTLAVRAAELQQRTNGLVPSGFDAWLRTEQQVGRYEGYDPDGEVYARS